VTSLPVHQCRSQHEVLVQHVSIFFPQLNIFFQVIIIKLLVIIYQQDKLPFRRFDAIIPKLAGIIFGM
jgi:energy-coupling factor transporter transmembrane protein EcfT